MIHTMRLLASRVLATRHSTTHGPVDNPMFVFTEQKLPHYKVVRWLDTPQCAAASKDHVSAFPYFVPINYKWPIYCQASSKPYHMFVDWFPTFQAASELCWVSEHQQWAERKFWDLEALLGAKTQPLYLIVFEILLISKRISDGPPRLSLLLCTYPSSFLWHAFCCNVLIVQTIKHV